MAQAAAEMRQAAAWNRAANDAARLAEADRSRQKGDILVASRVYARLARARPANPSTAAARERLTQLAQEGRKKLADIDAVLTRQVNTVSPSELPTSQGELGASPQIAKWREQLAETFRQYDQVADDYREVPGLSGELKGHIARERHRPEVAMVLNEPEAKQLLEVAQQHEADGNACCAYWVYRQAARLAPAPSGRLAENRFAELERDPKLVASAKACRELQKCHDLYNRAERLAKVDPDRAKELLAQIAARAPKDSELYAAVQRQFQP